MHKVFVIGPSGVGKSTLSKKLALKIKSEYLELDSVNHQQNWQPIEKDEFLRRVNKVTDGDAWVIDGNYLSTLGKEMWNKADSVVWIDLPFLVVLGRLLSRTLRRTIKREELWNGNKESFFTNFFTKDSVIYFMIGKYKSQKSTYNKIFANPEEFTGVKLIRLRKKADVDNFIENEN